MFPEGTSHLYRVLPSGGALFFLRGILMSYLTPENLIPNPYDASKKLRGLFTNMFCMSSSVAPSSLSLGTTLRVMNR